MLEYEVSSDDGRVSPDLFEEEEFSTPLSCAEDDSNQEWAAMVGYCTSSAPHTAHHAAGQGKEGDDHTRTDPCVPPESSPSAPTSRIGLNDNKAGMEGLDKTKINQIILEASKGSKFYENELRKEKQMSRRVGSMLEELRRITPAQRVAALRAADKELEVLEAERDLTRIIVHIDMDAFYASVEIRDNPHLKDVPMAVGSKSMLVSVYHSVSQPYFLLVCLHEHLSCGEKMKKIWLLSKAIRIMGMCFTYDDCFFSLAPVDLKLSGKKVWSACSHARLHCQEALPGSGDSPTQLFKV